MGESNSTAERFRYKSRLKGFSGQCISNMLLHSASVSSSLVREATWKPGLRLLRRFLRLLRMVHCFHWTLFFLGEFSSRRGSDVWTPQVAHDQHHKATSMNFWMTSGVIFGLLLFDCHPFSSFCALNLHCHSLPVSIFISLIVLRQNTALHRIFFKSLWTQFLHNIHCEHTKLPTISVSSYYHTFNIFVMCLYGHCMLN